MTLEEALTTDERPEAHVPLKAEDVWPFAVADPTFEDYMHWMALIEHNKQLLEGLNKCRTFTPRPYQAVGAVHFRDKKRAMIYDKPGLGKTLQASLALTVPAIVSCPGYLVDQWADFLADQFPHWKVARIHALLPRWERQALLDTPHDVWIVNHEMWAGRREPWKGPKKPKVGDEGYTYWKEQEWKVARAEHTKNAPVTTYTWPRAFTLVIDESHHFRNKDASQSKQIAIFSTTCEQVFLLTATPQYKDVADWWHQLHIMDPKAFRGYWTWREEYTYLSGWNENIVKVKPDQEYRLRETIAQYAIGRTYKQVGLYLPDLIEKVVRVAWHPDLKLAYKDIKQNLRIQTQDGYSLSIDPGAVLHTLRMMTANPEKVQAVKNIIEDIPDDGTPIIVFCWYRDTAAMLESEFNGDGAGNREDGDSTAVEITGKLTQKERLKRATALDTRVKCVTMASMSEGVDWSDASTVIFFEEDYTPGKIYQALSRVRRHSTTQVGERQPIVVYYMQVKDSVDEAVHEAVTERQGDVRKILRRALK